MYNVVCLFIASHLRYAAQVDVKTMTFDSEIELRKVKQLFPDAKYVYVV